MTGGLQAVVFDFDGVLANSEPLHLAAFQEALREAGIDLGREDYYERYLGYDDVGLVEALARDRGLAMDAARTTALLTRKAEVMAASLRSGAVLFPGARELVREAAAAVPVAIASGALRHEIVEILREAGLDSHFPVIVASGDTPQSKPSPQPYALAMNRLAEAHGLALDPRRCVAIEDSIWGIESARGAGLRCVAVATSYAADALTDAELVVQQLSDLTVARLDRLCEGS
ncbi:MAG: HAD family phosphatase [Acidobacteria bacterium]|nr:HAD family phosphatase [Acidobacteriota bacterium]